MPPIRQVDLYCLYIHCAHVKQGLLIIRCWGASGSRTAALPDSVVVERLKKLYYKLDAAIINEEPDVGLQVLEEMRQAPVTLSALKVSNVVKLLRKQRKQGCSIPISKGIDATISAWEQRTMEVAKRKIVPIKLAGKRARDGSSGHASKRVRGSSSPVRTFVSLESR